MSVYYTALQLMLFSYELYWLIQIYHELHCCEYYHIQLLLLWHELYFVIFFLMLICWCNESWILQFTTHERKEVTVNMRPYRVSSLETTISLQMTMLPVNISTASTGHKLQGRSKDSIIITSWPNFTNNVVFANWEYVVLSRVRTLSGLYLLKPIDNQKSFAPSHELRKFISRAKIYETRLMKNRKTLMKQFRKRYKQ